MIEGPEQLITGEGLSVRRPGWALVGLGAIGGGMLGSAALGGLGLLAGLAPAPILLGGGAIAMTTIVLLGLGLSQRGLSMPNLVAIVMSLGHALLFGAYALAVAMPELFAPAFEFAATLPFAEKLSLPGNSLLTASVLFLASMVAYSAIAPLSLIIFRYIALRK